VLKILIDATHLTIDGAGLARLEREVVSRISKVHECVLLLKSDQSSREIAVASVSGRSIFIPSMVPAIVVEQLIVPLVAHVVKPDVIHCFSGQLPVVPTPGRRVLSYLEDRRLYFEAHPPSGPYARVSARVQSAIADYSVSRADHIVAISHYAAGLARDAVHRRGRSAPPITVAPLGVSDNFVSIERISLESDGEARPYVVTLHSGDERDDIPWICEALRPFAGQLQLAVVGRLSDTAAKRLELLGRESGVILQLPGYISDSALADTYRNALAYVHASEYEGFGLGALEALACGTPVIARPSAAVVEVAGSAGLLADSPIVATKLMRRLLKEESFRDGARANSVSAAAQFTWTGTTAAILQAYRA
jgi:glycosyltransferase involved in cell wall biosynthesis